jgi:hypothetical protein
MSEGMIFFVLNHKSKNKNKGKNQTKQSYQILSTLHGEFSTGISTDKFKPVPQITLRIDQSLPT